MYHVHKTTTTNYTQIILTLTDRFEMTQITNHSYSEELVTYLQCYCAEAKPTRVKQGEGASWLQHRDRCIYLKQQVKVVPNAEAIVGLLQGI
jgi:hypothetical protein